MKDDQFIKKVLFVIAFLLALNIVLTVLYNSPVTYAAKGVEYKVISPYTEIENTSWETHDKFVESIEKLFNEYAKEGWEFIGLESQYGLMVFKR